MTSMNKRWEIALPLTPEANENLSAYPPVIRQILFNRGYMEETTARAFLQGDALVDTSAWQMTGIEPAVERILAAIDSAEGIAVYGDYDVDGVTATALLVQSLRGLGANVREYIPNRFDEGYGLNPEALTLLKEAGIALVISVDCGIRSPAEADHARSIGLDLIITDHHQPAEGDLPNALAVINPKQAGDAYPDKDLAGVGVAFKLVQALFERRSPAGLLLEDLVDLVALGTVADLAPLVGENRSLVRRGLSCLRTTRRQGLFSLANVAGLALARTTAGNIGYVLGPRLNAAGRLDSALAAFELLTTTDVLRAGQLAQQLESQNRERQALTRKIQEAAERMVQAENPDAALLFAVDPEFNSGVVGLAASRLVEKYYRPAVVGQVSAETTRCSCRSIPEFHITQALDRCADLLIRHGGHAAAAGFTVSNANLPALKERLGALAEEQLGDQVLQPTLTADREVPLAELKPELLKQLDMLQPTGYGNPEAVFVSRNVKVHQSRAVGVDQAHIKITLTDGHVFFDAIGFRLGHLLAELPPRIDVAFTFEANEYNGRTSLQLNLKDIKPAQSLD
jgi:single-stranded-DNA-specific exonuclease